MITLKNYRRCRAEQEKEERARRAAKRAKKIEERRRSKIKTKNITLNSTLKINFINNLKIEINHSFRYDCSSFYGKTIKPQSYIKE